MMSLDVQLNSPDEAPCLACGGRGKGSCELLFEWNITHNLNVMAEQAEIYKHLWRPDEIGITKAGQLVGPLRLGLARLKSDPDYYKKFNPSNGWGDYEGLVRFVEAYLTACEANPDADVTVSR